MFRRLNYLSEKLGFPNYIDFQLKQFDLNSSKIYSAINEFEELVDNSILPLKNYRVRNIKCIPNSNIESYLTKIGLNYPRIRITVNHSPLSTASLGRCYYIALPNDIRIVLNNKNGNEVLFRTYFHELGQAIYVSNIRRKEFVFRTNLGPIDKAMGILLENIVDNETNQMEKSYSLFSLKNLCIKSFFGMELFNGKRIDQINAKIAGKMDFGLRRLSSMEMIHLLLTTLFIHRLFTGASNGKLYQI